MKKQGKGQTGLWESKSIGASQSGLGEPKINADSAFAEQEKELQFRLYRFLLEKYSELINESERLTIGEIKGLVNSEDLTIQSILSDFKDSNYVFEKDFLRTAEKIFDFVKSQVNFVEPEINLNYWLSPKEVFSEKLADDEDLSVFLCSLLLGLGDEKASIIVAELDNLKTHAFVITEFEGRFFILDPAQKHDFFAFSGNRDSVLMNYSFKGAKIKQFLYRFNNSSYEQFVEPE